MKLNKMKIKVNNLGTIEKGEIELGNLTVIVGKNNTGKTYLSYTIFCILDYFFSHIKIDRTDFSENKKVIINLDFFKKQISSFPKRFNSEINSFFAVEPDFFKQPLLEIVLDAEDMFEFFKKQITVFEKKQERNYNVFFEIDGKNVVLNINNNTPFGFINDVHFMSIVVRRYIRDVMKEFVKPFAVTSERTGISLFYKDLDLSTNSRTRIAKNLLSQEKYDPNEILSWLNDDSSSYAHPIKRNIDIVRNLTNIKTFSMFKDTKKNKEILWLWKDILCGKFLIINNDIYFAKDKAKPVPLHASSSASKSLLLLDFFINRIAKENSILIIDEPELNLHPEAQRYMARLLVQLVKAGIKVIITTHSDYIVRELNNLIMLSKVKKHRKSLLKDNGYYPNEYIDSKMVEAYICDENTIDKVARNEYGLDIDTFDCLINSSNEIADSIVNALDEEVEDE